ncbi:hypothetical protein [Tenggerimyces flavus]|uniref:Uncharacterized protein n=1 Tax=Tenggerimyces flavus TaxID=1708749 RepID=A0ABV7YFC6_9ACTN|nr:hypothetical protein [Tenggerimyces flavus]MBM7788155.1 hypothetical protein [Tenggerimyces flavus]
MDAADRVRVLVGEPATRGRHPSVVGQLEAATAKLAAVGCPAQDSVEVLCKLMSRQLGSDFQPGPSMTMLDLHASGQVDIARRVSPPVLFLGAHESPGAVCRAATTGVEAGPVRSEGGDYLVAFSPLAVRLFSSEALANVPRLLAGAPTPCEVRNALLDSVDGRGQDPYRTAPPLAVVRREG